MSGIIAEPGNALGTTPVWRISLAEGPWAKEGEARGEWRAIVAAVPRRCARRFFSRCRPRSAHLADLEASSPAGGEDG